jgi:hypothetical protein
LEGEMQSGALRDLRKTARHPAVSLACFGEGDSPHQDRGITTIATGPELPGACLRFPLMFPQFKPRCAGAPPGLGVRVAHCPLIPGG